MTGKKVAEVVGAVVAELTHLTSEERVRVVQAALMLLGETPVKAGQGVEPAMNGGSDDAGALPEKARVWMKQNALTLADLEQTFHIAGDGVDVIVGEMPGKNGSERTLNAYVFAGLVRFLIDGNPAFDDKSARALCESAGCYDNTNHAKYMKNKGNLFSGSKEKGWTLTAPGLKHGVKLVKQLAEAKGE